MVEEMSENIAEEANIKYKTRTKSKSERPRPVYLWTVLDVQKWYRRHCGNNFDNEKNKKYLELFQKHEINGRTLLRITDNSLERMGIIENNDREYIWREILKQKLKTDILEIRDIELMNENRF